MKTKIPKMMAKIPLNNVSHFPWVVRQDLRVRQTAMTPATRACTPITNNSISAVSPGQAKANIPAPTPTMPEIKSSHHPDSCLLAKDVTIRKKAVH